jgi:hypothetical protein
MFVDVRLLGPVQVLDRSGQSLEIPGEPLYGLHQKV